jgi:ABC-2 type transport system ATP-binding protein
MSKAADEPGRGDEPAIELDRVSKTYPKGTRALDEVSLMVRAGTVCAFLGRNGAGKSTTVRILSTLARPTSGRAAVCGIDVTARPTQVRRIIGTAMQSSALDTLMTAREHLELAAGLIGYRGRDRRRRADELLDLLGLAGADRRAVAGFSGGMRRRLDLAMALIRQPRVLFLDEPSAGLDIQSRLALWEVIAGLKADGTTIFLATHDLGEANRLADTIAVIDRGVLRAMGTPDELKRDLGGSTATLELDKPVDQDSVQAVFGAGASVEDGCLVRVAFSGSGDELRSVLTAASNHGLSVVKVATAEPALEDVYVRLTGAGLKNDGEGHGDVGMRAVQQMGVARS